MRADYEFERTIRYARVQLRDGTWAEVEYAVSIDWERMRDVAERAVRNKSKQSTDGPVTVYVGKVTVGR